MTSTGDGEAGTVEPSAETGAGRGGARVEVELPYHLRTLARVKKGPVFVRVEGQVTLRAVLDALEEDYPILRGTIRDHGTFERRAFLRFFACGRDLSLAPPDDPLPETVAAGAEPLRIVGALAGG